MKKAIALLVVLAVALSLSVVSFAATDIIPGAYSYYDVGDNAIMFNDVPDTSRLASIAPMAATITDGTDTENYRIGDIILVNNNKIVGNDSLLRPDETYEFDVYYATGAVTVAGGTPIAGVSGLGRLTKAQIGDGSVRIRTVKGSSNIQSAKIKTSGRGTTMVYNVEIVTRANYGTKINDVEYVLSALNPVATLNETTHLFRVGFNSISESDTEVGEGGTITISNDNPVILKDQFSDIAKSANYKNVTFEAEDGNWSFIGKVAGMKDTNFTYNYDPDTNLLNTYPEHDFKFLNFPAGVNFPTTGEMRIDVSDISDTYGTMYAYLYRDGRMTEINGTYDSGADQLVFRTNYLGKFVISDRPITEATVPEEPEDEDEVVPVPETPNNTENPHTGAAAPNAMAAIGLLSIASAAVIRRRSK